MLCQHQVSIPSSRVGTPIGAWRGLSLQRFPSPQVGSGRLQLQFRVITGSSFHPLKSGRDQKGFELLKVGDFGFHPLKSGRD